MTRIGCETDEEALRRFYYNAAMRISASSSTASLDGSTNEYSVTITVEEGERRFGSIEIDSSVRDIDPQALRHLIKTKEARSTAPRTSRSPSSR